MDKKDIMKWAAVAGGAYLVYWYLTSYGPTGSKAEGHASYWDTWFGGAPAVAATTAATQPQQPVTTQPVLTQPSAPAPAPVAPVNNTAVKQQILAASAGQIQGGYAIADVWSYFWQQVTGKTITPEQFQAAFNPPSATDRGAQMNIDQFLSKLSGVGISGIGSIVKTPSIPSIPSMSFGGSLRRPNLQGLRPMRVPGNPQTIN